MLSLVFAIDKRKSFCYNVDNKVQYTQRCTCKPYNKEEKMKSNKMEENEMETEDRMSVSNFLTDVFCSRNRHELLPSDRILLVWNEDKYDENEKLVRRAGVGMPGGHVESGEYYINAGYRETEEETMQEKDKREGMLGVRDKIVIINDSRLFRWEMGIDKKSKPEMGKEGKSIFKIHWHLTVFSRLLIPVDEIVVSIGKTEINKAEWRRFDRLPSGLYRSHKKRITDFYNKLSDKELFDHVFNQKS